MLLPADLRTLDAVHLATVAVLGRDAVAAIVTYDARLAAAATLQGWVIRSPS